MSEEVDYVYLRHVADAGLVGLNVLEIGGRSWQGAAGNAEAVCRERGLSWTGADIEPGPGVSHVLDITDDSAVQSLAATWDSTLLFNILEHVYDPLSALRNALRLTKPGGTCVVVGPVVWQLHDYPADYWRPLPDFFLEFARREAVEMVGPLTWLFGGRLIPVADLMDGPQKRLPDEWMNSNRVWGRRWSRWSWLVQKGLNTTGRYTPYGKTGLGLVLRRPHTPADGNDTQPRGDVSSAN